MKCAITDVQIRLSMIGLSTILHILSKCCVKIRGKLKLQKIKLTYETSQKHLITLHVNCMKPDPNQTNLS